MKILSIITFSLLVLVSYAQDKEGFRLNGTIKGLESGMVKLSYYDYAKKQVITVDSAKLENGHFKMTGSLESAIELYISIDPGNYFGQIYVDNSLMELVTDVTMAKEQYGGKILELKLSGSEFQDEYDRYEKQLELIQREQEPLNKAYDEANNAYIELRKSGADEATQKEFLQKAEKAKEALEPGLDKIREISIAFITSNPDSYASALLVDQYMMYTSTSDAKKYYQSFTTRVQSSAAGKSILDKIAQRKKGSPGSKAFVFAKEDINGEQLSLADFEGQYVLVDFWASWCKPCRAGNPHLISLYKKYHEKGFEIIGVASDDSNPKAWHKAVEEDQIGIWKHVLGGDFRKGTDIGSKYDIHTLPTKVLIDPNGKIIGRFAADGDDDEAMDHMFEEIFEEQ